MKTDADAVMNVADAAKGLTMHVRVVGLKRLAFRLRLACWILKLGAWVAGMGCEIETTTGGRT